MWKKAPYLQRNVPHYAYLDFVFDLGKKVSLMPGGQTLNPKYYMQSVSKDMALKKTKQKNFIILMHEMHL